MLPEIIPNWHPVFVHFTIALFSVATFLFIVGKLMKSETITITAYVNLWLGAVITIGTVIMGFDAYNSVVHDGPSHAAMTNHRNWAVPTSVIFMALSIWSAMNYTKRTKVTPLFIVCMIFATGALGITGFKGGEAVYRYGLGVLSLPKISGDGGHESHTHGSSNDDEHSNTFGTKVSQEHEEELINEGHHHFEDPSRIDDTDTIKNHSNHQH